MNDKNQIAVVGAGIVGICCALYLQKNGYKVTLIDKKGVGQECSKGNAGHFATEQVFPLADIRLLPQIPRMLLDPQSPFKVRLSYLHKALPWFLRFFNNMQPKHYRAHSQALKSLNNAAIDAFLPLLEDANCKHLLTLKGSLLTYEKTSSLEIERQYRGFIEAGVNVEKLSKEQAQQLEPELSDTVTSALLFKDVGHTVNPELLSTTLANHFINQGGEFVKMEVNAILHQATYVELLTSQQSFFFGAVVVAAGAWSKKLLTQLGYNLPLDTERGYHLMLPDKNKLTRPVASAERKFIMTPMQTGLRLAGTVEFAGLDAKMDVRRADMLLPHAQQLVKGLEQEREHQPQRWMGCRPSLPDSLPVIGRAPLHENVLFAFGHQHLGLTQAAITGKLVSEVLQRKRPSIDLAPFSISRFGNASIKRKQAI